MVLENRLDVQRIHNWNTRGADDKMKNKEWNLSEKITDTTAIDSGYLEAEDVKEFIQRLKEEIGEEVITWSSLGLFEKIDKLAGEKLIDSPQMLGSSSPEGELGRRTATDSPSADTEK